MATKLTFKAITFEGDPSLVDFFFTQIKTLAKAHKWRDQETVQFLGSKLSGAALQFFTQNPTIYKATDLDFVEKEFKLFFAPISKTAALVEFNNLMLLPQESIRNFAHRLNVLTDSVHSKITDRNAIDHIKFTKFVSSIPSNLRIKIQEENIEDYNRAVERAQTLQEILQNEKILQACPNTSSADSISKQLLELTEKINAMTFINQKKDSKKDTQEREDSTDRNSYKQRSPFTQRNRNFKTRYSGIRNSRSFNYKPKQSHPPPTCQLCFKSGHVANQCFKWTRINTNRSYNKNSRDNEKFNRKGTRDNLN